MSGTPGQSFVTPRYGVGKMVCSRLNEVQYLCCSKSCGNHSLVCGISSCQECSRHSECSSLIKLGNFTKRMVQKGKNCSPSQSAILGMYDDLMEMIANERSQFLAFEASEEVRLVGKEKQLYDMLSSDPNSKKILPSFVKEVSELLDSSENEDAKKVAAKVQSKKTQCQLSVNEALMAIREYWDSRSRHNAERTDEEKEKEQQKDRKQEIKQEIKSARSESAGADNIFKQSVNPFSRNYEYNIFSPSCQPAKNMNQSMKNSQDKVESHKSQDIFADNSIKSPSLQQDIWKQNKDSSRNIFRNQEPVKYSLFSNPGPIPYPIVHNCPTYPAQSQKPIDSSGEVLQIQPKFQPSVSDFTTIDETDWHQNNSFKIMKWRSPFDQHSLHYLCRTPSVIKSYFLAVLKVSVLAELKYKEVRVLMHEASMRCNILDETTVNTMFSPIRNLNYEFSKFIDDNLFQLSKPSLQNRNPFLPPPVSSLKFKIHHQSKVVAIEYGNNLVGSKTFSEINKFYLCIAVRPNDNNAQFEIQRQ